MRIALSIVMVLVTPALAFAQGPKGGAPPAAKVVVTAARADTISEPRTFVGTVRPIRRSIVGSAAAGRVEEYLINEGDAVQAGQPIAHLRRGIIQAELNSAKAELVVRQAELGELEKSYQDEVEVAQARLTQAQGMLKYRQAKLDRAKALGASVSREVYEEESAMAVQAVSNVREHQAAVRMLTEGAREMKTEQARAKVEVQRAEVQRLQEQFDRHTMFAPFNGYVAAERTEVGQWVMQGDPVAEIVELEQVEIEVAVLEDFIPNVHPGMPGMVEVPALAAQPFQGQVAIVNPQADARTRTFPVKVRVPNQLVNQQPVLKSGMFARVTLPVGKPTPCVVVPKDAVVLGGPTPMIFAIASAGGKAAVRAVSVVLGPAQGTWIAAIGDIKEGEQVVIEGNERIRPGQEVRVESKEFAYP